MTIGSHRETGTAEEAEKKTKPKDLKEEADAVKIGTETKTMILTKKPYTKESESDCRATKGLKRNKKEKAEGETEDRGKREKQDEREERIKKKRMKRMKRMKRRGKGGKENDL